MVAAPVHDHLASKRFLTLVLLITTLQRSLAAQSFYQDGSDMNSNSGMNSNSDMNSYNDMNSNSGMNSNCRMRSGGAATDRQAGAG